MGVHLVFDLLAAALAFAMTAGVWRWRLDRVGARRPDDLDTGYYAMILVGAVVGGFGLGTLNLWLSGQPGLGRSILGAFAGAIFAVETWKARVGMTGSTGVVFVAGFATSVVVGRIGCFLSGLEDQTYGIPTTLPWGHDFGDGIARHPVQLYESAAMALFLVWALAQLARRSPVILCNGFYLLAFWYAAQRFVWEFFKPYAPVLGPLNLFHIVCLGLMGYAAFMLRRTAHVRA